jgi:hypothetical protein
MPHVERLLPASRACSAGNVLWDRDPLLRLDLQAILDDASDAGIGAHLLIASQDGDLADLSAGRGHAGAWRAHALHVLERGESVSLPGLAASPIGALCDVRGALVLLYDYGYVASQHEYAALARAYAAHARAMLISAQGRLDEVQQAAEAMMQLLDIHEPATAQHSYTVRRLAASLGMAMGLAPVSLLALETAAMLHDIGKVGVPNKLLRKRTSLSDGEWTSMRVHPAIGDRIVRHVASLAHLGPAIRHHHERWDGSGYPDRLSGSAIPLHAQLIGLADAYEAIRSGRPYRAPRDPDEAVAELKRGLGSQFAPSHGALMTVLRNIEVGQ